MWVRIPAWPVAALVSLSKTLNRNCFVLRMGRKAAGSVCRVMNVKEPWARFHETLRRVVAQDTMRNASYLATRCKNDFTKLTMRSMHRKLLDNYAEHVARYDDRYSRLRMRRVNLIIRKCVQNGVDAACRYDHEARRALRRERLFRDRANSLIHTQQIMLCIYCRLRIRLIEFLNSNNK